MSERGDCFIVAGTLLRELGAGHILCHGEPVGQGPIAGIRHWHAWIERTTIVDWPGIGEVSMVDCIDYSNGKRVEMPQGMYYNIGRTEERPIRRYTVDEAARRMLDTGHYGPWDE